MAPTASALAILCLVIATYYISPAICLSTSVNHHATELMMTAKKLGSPGRGILAADESTGTIAKRFSSIGVENNEQNRQKYRQMLFKSDGIEKYISGVIMFDETLNQKDDSGTPFPDLLRNKGIIPGIKVTNHHLT